MDIKKISLLKVSPSPMNPRKTFDEESLNELADNIEKQGLLQPITVRPTSYEDVVDEDLGEVVSVPKHYEIVCGERRYRALCILKEKEDAINVERAASHRKKFDNYQSISAIVREMTDEEAFDAMITENLQRRDVDPIEEAFAFGQLIEKGKTVEEVATRFGKSIRFIQDRCKLNNLIPELMVAVRDGDCSISAAMIICKLDEEQQKQWYNRETNSYHKELTKSSAKSFVNNLFMDIDESPWYDDDDQEQEEFTGGCGVACSKCNFNTNNHGCLFWEMKSDNEVGRCTNREMFIKKNIAYVLSVIEKESENYVKLGQPLEFGKTVVSCETPYYASNFVKGVNELVSNEIKSAGYEVVDPSSLFGNRCYYQEDDERLIKMLKSGEVYRCLSYMQYSSISPRFYYYYTSRKGQEGETTSDTKSVEAMDLTKKYKRNKELFTEKVTADLRTLADDDKAKNYILALDELPLTDIERAVLMTIIIREMNVRKLEDEIPELIEKGGADMLNWVRNNPDKHPLIIREYIREYISSNSVNYNSSVQAAQQTMLSSWLSDQTDEIITKHQNDFDKKQAKVAEKLESLGYDTDGQLLKK